MWSAALLAVAASFAQDAGLLQNGGFEQLGGERPARWDIFVAPFPVQAKGAAPSPDEVPTARVSREPHEGSYCVVLHSPEAYPLEPYNNWSQNILGKHSGKKLKLSGWLKTENAEGAALWAQCWQREPLHVAYVANTGESSPVYGTSDWQEVSIEFEVPSATDFLTVRCVLRGAGKAWFDDVRLEEVKETPTPSPEEKKEEPKAEEEKLAEAKAPEADTATAEEDSDAAATMKESTPAPAPEPAPKAEAKPAAKAPEPEAAAPAADTAAIEAELARLRKANASLQDELGSMRSDNKALVQNLTTLQEQIRSLQDMLRGEEPRPKAGDPIPPLVPMDFEAPGNP